MCRMPTNSSRVLWESRTIQIIEPICSTAGSPISITNETMPGFLTTSPADVGTDGTTDRPVLAARACAAPGSEVPRQILEVGAECLNWARSDLCGGTPAMVFPTAIKGDSPGCRRGSVRGRQHG